MSRRLPFLPPLIIIIALACSMPGYNPATQHVAHLESLSINPPSGNGQFTLVARYTPGDSPDGMGCSYTNLTTGMLAGQFTVAVPAASGRNYSKTEVSFNFTVTDPGIFHLTCYMFGYKQALGTSDEQSVDFSVSQVDVSSNVPDLLVAVVPVEPPAPIAAKDFAALNALLEQKIAALNQAELKFIHDMQATLGTGRPPGLARPRLLQELPQTEEDLKDLAGKAMNVAILSDQLSQLSARQDKGSGKAAQSAADYTAIARTTFSLVSEAQTVRQALMNNLMPGSQAIEIIAQYGMQLWSTSVTDGSTQGNPFAAFAQGTAEPAQALTPEAAAQVQSQINAGNSSIWIAQSAVPTTRTLNVPAAQSPVPNPFDPQVLRSLTTAEGQEDGDKAQQLAAANLRRLGATASSSNPTQERQLQVPTNPVAVSGSEQIQAGNLPTFPQGTATAVSKEKSDENAFMQTFGLTGEEKPSDQGKITVQDAPYPVHLSITSVEIKSTQPNSWFPGVSDVHYNVTVHWTTEMAPPQFTLGCMGDEKEIAHESGTLTLNGTATLKLSDGYFPVVCLAKNHGQLGYVQSSVLLREGQEPKPIFLEISNVVIKSVTTSPTSVDQQIVNFSYMVNWTTDLVPPEFKLVCVGGERNITQAKGALMIEGSDTRDISDTVTINCTAWHYSKETGQKELGSAEVDVPVSNAQAQTTTATFTSTVDAQATAFALQTSDAVATEVSGTQTAEFKMTAAAAETARAAFSATPPPVFTMNGTFSINFDFLGSYTTGFIKLTVNPASGAVTGSIDGAGGWSGEATCEDGSVKSWYSERSFRGDLVGQVDTNTGAIINLVGQNMTGQLSSSGGCGAPQITYPVPNLKLSGTIDLQNHTGRGIIQALGTAKVPDTGNGDWHAGE